MSPVPTTLLDVWEAGLPQTPAARAVLMLEAAGEPDVAGWTVGDRDVALLRAYCDTGRGIAALADCPECGEVLDVSLDPSALPGGRDGAVTVTEGEYAVTAHPPTAGDLQALSPTEDVESSRRRLLTRCLVSATYAGEGVAADELPADVVHRVEVALGEADPAADIQLTLVCPECETTWSELLDPVVFAWSAVESAARRLATDVHALAQAYGWSEQEILGLSPFRRHLYLSAVQP